MDFGGRSLQACLGYLRTGASLPSSWYVCPSRRSTVNRFSSVAYTSSSLFSRPDRPDQYGPTVCEPLARGAGQDNELAQPQRFQVLCVGIRVCSGRLCRGGSYALEVWSTQHGPLRPLDTISQSFGTEDPNGDGREAEMSSANLIGISGAGSRHGQTTCVCRILAICSRI